MIDNRTVGRCIARLRVAKGMTQQGLAAALNVSLQAVSKWETGAALPDMQTFYSMSKLFGVTMEQILTGEAGEEDRPSIRKRILDAFGGRNAPAQGNAFEEAEPVQPVEPQAEEQDAEAAEAEEMEPAMDAQEETEQAAQEEEQSAGQANSSAQNGEESVGTRVARALEGLGPMIDEAMNAASDALENAGKAVVHAVRRGKPTEDVNFARLKKLAPFMSKGALDQLVRQWCTKERVDWDAVCALAPFLSRETLDALCDMCLAGHVDYAVVQKLAPFLGKDSLEKLIQKADGQVDWDMVQKLAPFLDRKTVDRLVLQLSFGEKQEPAPSSPAGEKRESAPPSPAGEKKAGGGKRAVMRGVLRKALEEGNDSWAAEHMDMMAGLLAETAGEERERLLEAIARSDVLLAEWDFEEIPGEIALSLWEKALDAGKISQIDVSTLLEALSPEETRHAMRAAFDRGLGRQIAPCEWAEYMDAAGVADMANRMLDCGMADGLEDIVESLQGDDLAKLALRLAEQGNWTVLDGFYEYLDETTLTALAEQAAAQSQWGAIDAIGEYLGD